MQQSLHPVLARQIELIAARDLDGLMDQYADDAQLVRFDRAVSGRDALREFFAGYLELGPRVVSVERHTTAGDALAYEAIVELGGKPTRTYGALVLRDGRIWRQFAAVFPQQASGP